MPNKRLMANFDVDVSSKFDREFDFESSNAQFDKNQIEKELTKKMSYGSFVFPLLPYFLFHPWFCHKRRYLFQFTQ